MNEGLPKGLNLDLSYKVPNITDIGKQLDIQMDDLNDHIQEMNEKKVQYDQEVLQTLKSIEKNTGDISQLVSLLHDNSDKQTEILGIMTEIMAISTSKSSEEAETMYRRVMNKITQTFDDVEATEKLLGLSKVVYHTAVAYIKQKISGEI